MMGIFENFGIGEILLILAVVLLLFGARKLPEMARSLGRSSNEFKKGLKEGSDDATPPADAVPPPPAEKPADKPVQSGTE